MKQYKPINLVAVLLVSFVAWVYCVAPAVLGLIYQAYPGRTASPSSSPRCLRW